MTARAALAALFLALSMAPAAHAVDVLHLTIVGGSQPGASQVSVPKGLCALGYSRPDEWSVRYAVDQPSPRRLSSLQLLVPEANAASVGARQFDLAIAFGPFQRPTVLYEVETRSASRRQQGTGTVTIADRDSRARITFDATTKDGVKLRGTVDCRAVSRAFVPGASTPASGR